MESQPSAHVQVPLNVRSALRKDLSIVPRQLGQEPCYVIEDLLRSKFYRIGVREFTFISLLDGKTSLRDALIGRNRTDRGFWGSATQGLMSPPLGTTQWLELFG